MEKPKHFDYIRKLCLVACSKEKRDLNLCTCIQDSRNYAQAIKEYEEWLKENNGK